MSSFQFEMKYLKLLIDPLNEITVLDAYDCVKFVLRNLHALYIVKTPVHQVTPSFGTFFFFENFVRIINKQRNQIPEKFLKQLTM
ncbi:Uncharacterised protein [Streptococcus pneumoniae]|nr:Uncharacterised protein [Streptococcus pneumoniae]